MSIAESNKIVLNNLKEIMKIGAFSNNGFAYLGLGIKDTDGNGTIIYDSVANGGEGWKVPHLDWIGTANNANSYFDNSSRYVVLWIGTDSTEKEATNYSLNAVPLSSISNYTKVSLDKSYNNGAWTLAYSRTFTIAAGESVTINEVGLVSGYRATSSSTSTKIILLDRQVLPEPIVITPDTVNRTYTFTMSITF